MLCDKCKKERNLSRGVKFVTCAKCNETYLIGVDYSDICVDCSDSLHICQKCGCSIDHNFQLKNVSILNIITEHQKQKSVIDRLSSNLKTITTNMNRKVILELKLAKLKHELEIFEDTIMSVNQKIW